MKLHVATVLALVSLLAPSSVAAASPPPNDNLVNATPITTLPYSATVDLTDATTEPGENVDQCYVSTRTVWYRFTAPAGEILDVDITGSDPDVGTRIYFDYGGGPSVGYCLSATYPTAQISVNPSFTLYFQVTAETGTNARLQFSSEPLLTLSSTLGATASIERSTGTTLFTGTVTCNKQARADVLVTAYQRQGRNVVIAQGWTEFPIDCGPTPAAWTARVYGPLVSGSASVNWTASAGTTGGASEFVQVAGGPNVVKVKPR